MTQERRNRRDNTNVNVTSTQVMQENFTLGLKLRTDKRPKIARQYGSYTWGLKQTLGEEVNEGCTALSMDLLPPFDLIL